MKKLSIICIFLFLIACSSTQTTSNEGNMVNQTLSKITLKEALSFLDSDSLVTQNTKAAIPKSLISAIEQHTNEKFKLANPGERSNVGCVQSRRNLPSRQLNFFAIGKNASILSYKKGTRGVYDVILLATYREGKVSGIWLGSSIKAPGTLTEIINCLKQQCIHEMEEWQF
ncbi:MAG: hypothetical protein EP332_04370 [Bacteroidetes bacterium]|nr:MAG: hypothetical protein EP332_04370 [Bacteroidota bacterium]